MGKQKTRQEDGKAATSPAVANSGSTVVPVGAPPHVLAVHPSLRRRGASENKEEHVPPQQPGSVTEKVNGSIGLVLALRDMSNICPKANGMRVWVKRVLPSSPAEDSLIRPGHELRAISGRVGAPVMNVAVLMSTTQRLDQIASLLAGPVDSPCTLTFYNYDAEASYKVTLVRRLCPAVIDVAARSQGAGSAKKRREVNHDLENTSSVVGLVWGILCGLVWGGVRALLIVAACAAILLRLSQITAFLPDSAGLPLKQQLYSVMQSTEPAFLAVATLLTFLLLFLLHVGIGMGVRRSAQGSAASSSTGGKRKAGRLLGFLYACTLALFLFLLPAALSYTLDHKLLWKVGARGGDGGAVDVGVRSGGLGQVLRGKVAVVIEGYRGQGFQVSLVQFLN